MLSQIRTALVPAVQEHFHQLMWGITGTVSQAIQIFPHLPVCFIKMTHSGIVRAWLLWQQWQNSSMVQVPTSTNEDIEARKYADEHTDHEDVFIEIFEV